MQVLTGMAAMSYDEMRARGLRLGRDVVGCIECHYEHREKYLWPLNEVSSVDHTYLCPEHSARR